MVWNPRDHDAPTRVVDLDHAATTRLRPEARSAMEPFLADRYGNPSGIHAAARDALRALDEARERVAGVLGCTPGEVVLTSGGTESDVHAVSGGMPPRPGVPVCAADEHHAVLRTVEALDGRRRGARVDLLHGFQDDHVLGLRHGSPSGWSGAARWRRRSRWTAR